jgi:CheY-like chemotaxis protein/two-component sensor histidine kinase
LEVHLVEMPLTDLTEGLAQKFRHVADEKGLAFHIKIADNLPNTLQTDAQRLKQILNNLLSNAFKFTAAGEIRLTIGRPLRPEEVVGLGLDATKTIALSVTDTGIGIPKDKLEVIFGAFQQVDGTISRRYGGTGLGLSIARQLARLLGGDIKVHSETGQGSTFTLYLPETAKTMLPDFSVAKKDTTPPKRQEMTEKLRQSQPQVPIPVEKNDMIEDDRHHLHTTDRILLVIEDDRKFLNILKDLAREKEFKCLIADDGKVGLQMAEEYHPHAIILDVSLPQIDGWTIMERLKDSPNTRHIPVHFISSTDQSRDAKQMGAIGHLLKPVSMAELNEAFKKIEKIIAKTLKNLLVMVSHPERQQKILNIVGSDNIQATIAVNPLDAWSHLKTKDIDCIILDVEVEPEASLKFLEQLHQEDNPVPVIIYTERELSLEEEQSLQRCADNLTVKAVRTPERLLDEVTLFLHQVEALLPKEKQKILRMVHDKEAILAGKKVLVVDDDTRNIFALMSVLENKNMEVIAAQHGKEALEVLNEHPNMDIVLMDIMMPEMDGYETMQKIRAQPRFRKLPIIALTAKAMKSDKAKCIEAGASDYLAKPVDTDKLVSLMRVWLYR